MPINRPRPFGLPTLLGLVGIGILATFPLILHPLDRLIGDERVDVWNHAWGAFYFADSFSRGQWPLQTQLLAGPAGGRLWYVDPLGALIGAPLLGLIGVVPTWNLLIFGQVVLAAAAARALALAVRASERASWLAAGGFACSPYLLSEVHNGISEAIAVGPAVFTLAMQLRFLEKPAWKTGLALSFWACLTVLSTYYYALGTALVALGITLLHPRSSLRALPGLLAAALPPALTLGLAWMAIRWTLEADPLVFRPPQEMKDLDWVFAHNALDPWGFVRPGDFQSVDLAKKGEGFRHSSYLGLVALGLALGSGGPRLGVAACVGLVFSLGPWLWVDGTWWGSSLPTIEGQGGAMGGRLTLPYRWLLELLPPSGLTHPQRVGMPAIALVLALAARGAGRVGWPRLLAALVVVEFLVFSAGPWPVAHTPVLDVRIYEGLAERTGDPSIPREPRMVLDLPAEFPPTMLTSRYLVYQTIHGLPIPYKPDVRINTASLGGLPAYVRLTREAELLSSVPDDPRLGWSSHLPAAGVRWVVVHRELPDPHREAVEERLTAWYGPPEVIGTHALWDTLTRVRAQYGGQLPPPRPPDERAERPEERQGSPGPSRSKGPPTPAGGGAR